MPSSTDLRLALLSVPAHRRERFLLERYRGHGDADARDALVEQFLPLCDRFARRVLTSFDTLEDLKQVARVGLLQALARYDPDRQTPFAVFATPYIVGTLKHHLRDATWAVHVPRAVKEGALRMQRALSEHGFDEVAAASSIGLNPTEAREALRAFDAAQLREFESRFEPGGDEPGYARTEVRLAITSVLAPSRELEILRLRFVEDLTQATIAERFGVSQAHVSRLIREALTQLEPAFGIEANCVA